MGMGMSVSPQIWQQFVDLVFQDDLIKHKQNFDVIMDDTFIHSTAEEHMDDLMDLFKVLRKYGLKISPHKCQFFKKKIVYMGLEFQIQKDKVCYTPLKDKCDAIRNLESPKTLRQTRAFCRMVNFLSSFLLSCTEDFQGIRFFFYIIVKYRNYHRCSRNQYRLMLHLMFHLLERSVKLCKEVR